MASYFRRMFFAYLQLFRRLCSQKFSAHGLVARLHGQQQWDFATLQIYIDT